MKRRPRGFRVETSSPRAVAKRGLRAWPQALIAGCSETGVARTTSAIPSWPTSNGACEGSWHRAVDALREAYHVSIKGLTSEWMRSSDPSVNPNEEEESSMLRGRAEHLLETLMRCDQSRCFRPAFARGDVCPREVTGWYASQGWESGVAVW